MSNLIKALAVACLIAGVAIGVFLFVNMDKGPVVIPPMTNGNEITQPDKPVVDGPPTEIVNKQRYDVPGRCSKEGGGPLARVRVQAFPIASSQALAEASSDATGAFRIKGLPAGRYNLRARLAGFQEVRSDYLVIEGEEQSSIELVFASGLAISGHVFDELRKPIGGAKVTAFRELVPKDANLVQRLLLLSKIQEIQSTPGITATTDSEGWYQIVGLSDDDYQLLAVARGFAPEKKAYVKAGSSDVDFVMPQGGVLNGVVLAPGGPVENAELLVYRQAATGSGQALDVVEEVIRRARPPLASRVTDGSGEFSFDELGGAVNYRLAVSAPGYQGQDLTEIVVELGQVSDITVTLQPGLVITGIVRDPSGRVLENAVVKANYQSGKPSAQLKLTDEGLRTDVDGVFLFDTLEDGEYRIVVSHELFASFSKNRVKPTDDTQIDIQLTEGGQVEGRILDSLSQAPIAGATVRVRDVAGVEKVGTSDRTGLYLVQGLTQQPNQRPSTVTVEADGYARLANASVVVQEGVRTAGQDFELEKNGVVSGIVVDANDKPLPNVKVTVKRQHSPTVPVVINVSGTVQANAKGEFEITDVSPGEDCFVAGNDPRFLECETDRFAVEANGNITGMRLVMREGGSIEGIVTDDAGLPIEGACVALQGESLQNVNACNQEKKVNTDANGNFILSQLPAGTHKLLAASSGFLDTELDGIIVDEGRLSGGIQLQMTKGSFLAGVVVDGGGQPLHGAKVTVIDSAEGIRKQVLSTDNSGYFRCESLGPFEVQVNVEMSGYSRETRTSVPVNSDRVDFTLYRLGSVQGRVFAQGGDALRAFAVHPKLLLDGREITKYPSKTFSRGEEGQFEYKGLEPGTYNIFVGAPGYAPQTIENVVIQSDLTAQMAPIYLDEGGKLTGYVISAGSNEPVVGARVSAQGLRRDAFIGVPGTRQSGRGARKQANATTDRNGYFEIIGLAHTVENVTLKVEHRDHITQTLERMPVNSLGLEIVLDSGATIAGYISVAGEAVAGRQVLLTGNGRSDRSVSDRKGSYRFVGLPAGNYTLRVTQFGLAQKERTNLKDAPTFEVRVGPGEFLDYDIILER